MNYMAYYPVDVINGDGVRNTLFVSGCEHQCKGCYNKSTWNKDNGFYFDKNMEDKIIYDLNNPDLVLDGLSLSGGDPLFHHNVKDILRLVKRVKKECQNKNIWVWTGYLLENLTEKQKEILNYIDVLIDGKFIQELKDPDLYMRGSSNQRIFKINHIKSEIYGIKNEIKMMPQDLVNIEKIYQWFKENDK